MDKEKKQAKQPVVKGRKILVVKRKKVAPKKASGALPTFQKRRAQTTVAVTAAAVDNAAAAAADADDPFDTMLASLPNDCALGIQALQQNVDTCIAIPIPSDTGNYIKGVLELHLYRQLHADDSRGDTAVSRELADLLAANTIRKLSSPSREINPLQVILFTADYEQAARNTIHRDPSSSSPTLEEIATEWLMRQLPHLTGQRIAYTDFQGRWSVDTADNTGGQTLDRVLETLTRQQLLLLAPLERSYQLWLPTWGVVLQAWETARKKALMNLKRSSYKERSLSAMQQKYSPISTVLLLDWMESIGQVELIDRPAGKFVRLPSEVDE
eukprot:scaffold162_cov176-Amphora_coffeaeformis.AAC.2